MMFSLKFEFERLVAKKSIPISLAVFLLLSGYFTLRGIADFRSGLAAQQHITAIEAARQSAPGRSGDPACDSMRIIARPTPLAPLFYATDTMKDVVALVDRRGMSDVMKYFNGRDFLNQTYFGDFGGMLFIFGSVFCLWLGLTLFPDREFPAQHQRRHLFRLAVARHIWLALAFTAVFGANCIVLLAGFRQALSGQWGPLLWFYLVAQLFLGFFYWLGLVIFRFGGRRRHMLGFTLWLTLVLLVPEGLQTLAYHDSRTLPDKERINRENLAAWQRGADAAERWTATIANQRREEAYFRLVEGTLRRSRRWALFCPSTFYSLLCADLSGSGQQAYIDFLRFQNERLDRFIRHATVPGRSQVFAPPLLFRTDYLIGILLTAGSILIFILLLARRERAAEHTEPTAVLPIERVEKGKFYFILSGDERLKHDIQWQLERIGAGVVRRIRRESFDTGTALRSWARLLCRVLHADEERFWKNMEELPLLLRRRGEPVGRFSEEELNLVWLALHLAVPAGIYVLDDFISGMSRRFEADFRILYKKVSYFCAVIYFGREMYEPITICERIYATSTPQMISVNPERISLR